MVRHCVGIELSRYHVTALCPKKRKTSYSTPLNSKVGPPVGGILRSSSCAKINLLNQSLHESIDVSTGKVMRTRPCCVYSNVIAFSIMIRRVHYPKSNNRTSIWQSNTNVFGMAEKNAYSLRKVLCSMRKHVIYLFVKDWPTCIFPSSMRCTYIFCASDTVICDSPLHWSLISQLYQTEYVPKNGRVRWRSFFLENFKGNA